MRRSCLKNLVNEGIIKEKKLVNKTLDQHSKGKFREKLVKMAAKINQKEYLKKYLSGDVGGEKKKKKKKKPKEINGKT